MGVMGLNTEGEEEDSAGEKVCVCVGGTTTY